MSAIVAGIVGMVARELIQFGFGLVKKYLAQRESDSKIDQHAKDVSKEMENTHDPTKMDSADSDILSGR